MRIFLFSLRRFPSQTDWNDGRALCGIVRNLGGPAPPYDKIDTNSAAWEHNLQLGKFYYQYFFYIIFYFFMKKDNKL